MVVPIFVLVSVDCYFGSYFLDIWLVIRTGVSFRLHYDQVTCGTNKNQILSRNSNPCGGSLFLSAEVSKPEMYILNHIPCMVMEIV